MKRGQFAVMILVILAVIFGLLALLPQRGIFFAQITEFLLGTWRVIYNIVVILWILLGAALLGYLAKGYLVRFIDTSIIPNIVMENWMRHTLGLALTLTVFVGWIVTIPWLIKPWNFLYHVGRFFT